MVPTPRSAASRREDFQTLYDLHAREVWAIAYARRLDPDTASDIVQETFLRLWNLGDAADVIQNPRAWLLRVSRNLAEDTAKSAFRRNGTQAPELFRDVRSTAMTPLDQMVNRESFAQVRQVLNELAAADRDVLTLRYALDYDAAKIAEVLGIATTAVHMRLSRARQRLADKLLSLGLGVN
jgi:RNA polymerase sigma-70 factor (ECF subfamily)